MQPESAGVLRRMMLELSYGFVGFSNLPGVRPYSVHISGRVSGATVVDLLPDLRDTVVSAEDALV